MRRRGPPCWRPFKWTISLANDASRPWAACWLHGLAMSMESADRKEAKVTENIRVYVRVRTGTTDAGSCLHMSPQSGEITAVRQPKPGEPAEALQHSFKFDAVGDAETDQASVFAAVGSPIAEAALSGFNATVFAFGQTGAGKTHTMFGGAAAQRGLAPRMLESLLTRIGRGRCSCTALEIHNESISDLLAPAACTGAGSAVVPPPPSLRLREDAARGVHVANITHLELSSAEHALQVLGAVLASRTVGQTAMNRQSSRSHAVLTLHVEQELEEEAPSPAQPAQPDVPPPPPPSPPSQAELPPAVLRRSQLHLVDLAGSERYNDACSRKSFDGARRKEACNINRSLSALGNVMGGALRLKPRTYTALRVCAATDAPLRVRCVAAQRWWRRRRARRATCLTATAS